MSQRPRLRAAAIAVAAGFGVLFASAPSFSGLALLAILLLGAFVGFGVFAAPYPTDPQAFRPADPVLRWWKWWAVSIAALEFVVLAAGDDLRWPTLSALQDPLTSADPLGRFVAGTGWAAAGFGLVAMMRRYRPADATTSRWVTATVAGLGLMLLAVLSVDDGPMLHPRDAPTAQAVGVDNTALADWPVTAWLTSGLFLLIALAALVIHARGRASRPPGTIPDLLAWLMSTRVGRTLGFAGWLWCGWHFLGR